MAEVSAFRGWRYSSDVTDISTLVAPPYDVLSQSERDAFAQANPHNVVELELAPGAQDLETPGNRYVTAKAVWDRWVSEGVLKQDDDPAIYALEQRFTVNGQEFARVTFITAMQLHTFDEMIVIPHELTLPKALGDRYRLLSTMNVNTSQVFGIYSDPTPAYNEMLAQIRAQKPVATATDADGVKSTLWAMTDESFIQRFTQTLEGKQVFIADGHHRYTVALAWRDECRKNGVDNPGAESVMVALANMDDPQLTILAYHRALKAEGTFDANAFLSAVSKNFDLEESQTIEEAEGRLAQVDPDLPSFVIVLKGRKPMLATLKADIDLDEAIAANHTLPWKSLDVSVLHEMIVSPLLGVSPQNPETLSRIAYSQNAGKLIARLDTQDSDAVFIMRPTRMDQLQNVALGGETMPQKSTFFYPKLPSGMVFRAL